MSYLSRATSIFRNNEQDFRTGSAYNYRILTRSADIITLDDLHTHLRITTAEGYDDELTQIASAASEMVNLITGEFMTEAEIEAYYQEWFQYCELPHRYIKAVTSVQYYAPDETLTTVEDSKYFLDNTGQRPVVVFKEGGITAAVSDDRANPVVITYETEIPLGAEDPAVKQAALLIATELFETKAETTDMKRSPAVICAERLLQRYRRYF